MKKVRIITIILTVILISLVSFVGVYTQTQNRMENQVKDYKLGMNLSGYRQVRLEPVQKSEEESAKEITDADVAKTKEIMETRLNKFGAKDYFIRASKESIVIEMEDNEYTDMMISNAKDQGKLELVDSETKEVYMTNEDIEEVSALYGYVEEGTGVYLNIEFTEAGKKEFEELTTKYKTIEKEEKTEEESSTNENAENNTDTAEGTENTNTTEQTQTENTETSKEGKSEETKQPKLSLMLDGTEILSQSFDEPVTTGRIQLSFNNATTSAKILQENMQQVSTIAVVLNNGVLPVEYQATENEYVKSDITTDIIFKFSMAVSAIILIGLIVLSIKYKTRGLVASAMYIGIVALYLLIIRYTNVAITIEGIAGILVVLIVNYIVANRIVAKKEIIQEDTIPIVIAIIGFCFIGWAQIASLGMVMFWGAIALMGHAITYKLLEK